MGLAKFCQILVKTLITLLSWIVTPIANKLFSIIYDGSAKTIPLCEDPLLLQSARTIAEKIRKRELKAETVMTAFIGRVTQLHKDLNCVCARRFDEALQEARALDVALDTYKSGDKYSAHNMPFLGVPLSVKEQFKVKGMPNSAGLVCRKSYRSDEDCIVVRRIREAGAIPFCMTNTSELCMWYESSNRLYGRSCNPYNTTRIVGGSSGGEAANIASGGAVIGIGSDIGGSIRMPAFFNGIFGHKPSRGLVPNEGQFPIATGSDVDLLSTGPLCRYMEDILPMLKVMTASNNQANLDQKIDMSKVKVYNVVDDGGSILLSSVDPELKAAQAKVMEYLQTTVGVASVETVSIPKLRYSLEMWAAKMTTSGGTSFCEYMADCAGAVNPVLEMFKWTVGLSSHTLPAILLGLTEKLDHLLEGQNVYALRSLEKFQTEMAELLDENSVMLYPSHPKLAPYHNQPLLYPFNWAYTGVFNTLGLPVTQVPLGLSKEGLPLGVQIVAGMNRDRLSIAVAEELAIRGLAAWTNPGSN